MDKLKLGNYVKVIDLDDCVGEVIKIDEETVTFTDLVACKDVTCNLNEVEKVTPRVVDHIVQKYTRAPLKYRD